MTTGAEQELTPPAEFRPQGAPLGEKELEMRRLVLKQIDADPGSFSMFDWESPRLAALTFPEGKPCETARCIAGWAQFLACGRVTPATAHRDGIRLLGLTEEEFLGPDSDDEVLFMLEDDRARERLRELAGE